MESHTPQDGDVLISNPTATLEHEICILPRPPHTACRNHDQAVAEGRQLAEQLRVDAWLSEDNRHYLRIASYRP